MNTYLTSDGKRVTKASIDREVLKAKERHRSMFYDLNGYYFCEHCKRNDCSMIASSHIISVKECQNNGCSELAYDINNLELLGQKCHAKFETLSNQDRRRWYEMKAEGFTYDEFILIITT